MLMAACEPMWPHSSNSLTVVHPLWNHFLLFLPFHIQTTNATFSIRYTSEEWGRRRRGRGFIFQCIAGAWVAPHGLECWWGSSCCVLCVKEQWKALKEGYCCQGGAPDDLMQYEGKRPTIKTPGCTTSAFHMALCIICFWYCAVQFFRLFCCCNYVYFPTVGPRKFLFFFFSKGTSEVVATHRFSSNIVTTLSVDDVLLQGGGDESHLDVFLSRQ